MLGFVQVEYGTKESVLDHWEFAKHFSPVHFDQASINLKIIIKTVNFVFDSLSTSNP
jgi:hypothetical protein